MIGGWEEEGQPERGRDGESEERGRANGLEPAVRIHDSPKGIYVLG